MATIRAGDVFFQFWFGCILPATCVQIIIPSMDFCLQEDKNNPEMMIDKAKNKIDIGLFLFIDQRLFRFLYR